jgi:hypothetical protein
MSKTHSIEQVSPVHVGRALESLRNSDFDTLSAVGEVIDNSIEANAKNIRIWLDLQQKGKKTDITEMAFGDDGDGMDVDTLHRCLQLGFSTNYNDRKGIGRFGVGMTLGAITQCKRIEVFSKPKGGEWHFTYLDLDEMKKDPNPIIPTPIRTEIAKKYHDLIDEHGTLVIWKKLDRAETSLPELNYWIGRTYRKFIGEEIIKDDKIVPNPNVRKIFINGDVVDSIDPLYVTKNRTTVEDRAELDKPIVLRQDIHPVDAPEKYHGASEIIIRMSLLPQKWRQKEGDGGSAENKKRYVTENEGISILRNDREVFYGHIPYYKLSDKKSGNGFINLDRFWGCEISFNAELDHWFSVKNIKVGAKPLPALREEIENAINDTIYEYRKEIRRAWAEYKTNQLMATGGAVANTDEAEDILKKNTPSVKIDPQEKENAITELLKNAGEEREVILTLKQKMAEQPFTFRKSDKIDRRGPFIDIASRAGTTLITLNMNHPFFQKFFEIINKIESNVKETEKHDHAEFLDLSKQLETALYLLLGSYAAAQREFTPEQSQTATEFIKKLEHNWTFYLERTSESIKD